MRRNTFTEDEITLCTYSALYDGDDFGGAMAIHRLTNRSQNSISMKISNIVAMVDYNGVPRFNSLSGLTGTPTGKPARNTNWDVVEPLTQLSREDLLRKCRDIAASK